MIAATPLDMASGLQKVEAEYDYWGRRISKKVYSYTAGAWTLDTTTTFVYDGWNVIQETITPTGGSTSTVQYVWGLDLSGTLQGAGGIGGLLLRKTDSGTFVYLYDANGNVEQLVNVADGSLAARYKYDPFGVLLVADGPEAEKNPYRFSTKYVDGETGLVYYGYRDYSLKLGRWTTYDPLREDGFSIIQSLSNALFYQLENNFSIVPFSYKDIQQDSQVSDEVIRNFDRQGLDVSFMSPHFLEKERNLYLFAANNPLSFVDARGLDITIETGNDKPWYSGGLNNLVHQQICVDVWDYTKGCNEDNKWECCHKGKVCFSFAAIGVQKPQFSKKWLGWDSPVVGAVIKGMIYDRDPVEGAQIDGRHVTTMRQDGQWTLYMWTTRLETTDGYSVARHNCRKFSQWEFRDAPLHW